MAVRSQISAIVANQLGKLEGQLEARIQTEALNLLDKFSNQCPDNNELVKIVNVRNNLLKVINNFQKVTNRFSRIPNQLRPPISAANILISLLKSNPTPVAIGTPPNKDFGGLISARTTGQLNTSADRLSNVVKLLEALEDDLETVNDLVNGINPSLNNIRGVLESVNISITDCVSQSTNGDIPPELLQSIQPLENTGSEGTPSQEYFYTGANGRNYTLAIIQEAQGEGPVPRRIAVAKDNLGVIILRGQPSFSSDTKVLLDELKFRIDNQLP